MEKKLIGFNDELLKRINEYATTNNTNFTDAVRKLVETALNAFDTETVSEGEPDAPDFRSELRELQEKVEKLSWWTTDDNTSRLGNLEVEVTEMGKKLNTVVAIAKKLKGHTENRDIHLQD